MPLFDEISLPNNTGNFMTNKISIEKKREYLPYIISNFDRLSQREIARRLDIGKTTVNRWSEEIGLKFKKHTVNEEFFNELNENSSYILGYIFADGNVNWNTEKGYYCMTITASEKDKEHLERIRAILESTKPLLYSEKTRSYRLIVNNKKMCQKLIDLGVIPRKSLTVKFPYIPEQYIKHFIRGVIDGDGSVNYFDRKRSPYFSIRIYSGSKRFLKKLVVTIRNAINIGGNIRKVGNNTYGVVYSCSRGKKLAEYVYLNSNIYLKRKYLPYKNNVLEVQKNGE